MAKKNISVKHLMIDKATQTIITIVAITALVAFFAIASSKALLGQLAYQNRVSSHKQTALTLLQADLDANNKLLNSYKSFVNHPQNIIGGDSTTNTGSNSGDNAKIILDALPSQYDFPATATSIQYLLNKQSVNIHSIGGTDQAAGGVAAGTGPTTQSSGSSGIAIPFQFEVDGNYQAIQDTIGTFEKSIRPMQFLSVQMSGDQGDITLTTTVQTYYQDPVVFNITTENVN
jgi:hypothetical protein